MPAVAAAKPPNAAKTGSTWTTMLAVPGHLSLARDMTRCAHPLNAKSGYLTVATQQGYGLATLSGEAPEHLEGGCEQRVTQD
jgi:hypothetical protein